MNAVNTIVNNTDSHQKISYQIESVDRQSNPRKDIMKSSNPKLKINNTEQLDEIAFSADRPSSSNEDITMKISDQTSSPICKRFKKRRRIVLSDDESSHEDKNKRRSIEIERIDEDKDELDSHGNIKGLISYSDDELYNHENITKLMNLSNDDKYYLSDDDEDYLSEDNNKDSFEKDYINYLKTLSDAEKNELKNLEQELVAYNKENTKPLKYQILTLKAPINIKNLALTKLKSLSNLDKNSNDYAYEWSTLNHLLRLPWGVYVELPVNKTQGKIVLRNYLTNAMKFLQNISYGQIKAKSTLLLELGRYLENPDDNGFVLGIKGPPGSGKTTLINNGLAKLLNRPFFRFDLGGAKHADSLFGSRKVFERSDLGDLAKALIEAGCFNPIFFFDELDKLSASEYGKEYSDGLNDLTDKARNNAILDHYLGIHLNLSRAIYVFAYNSSEYIPQTLRSRIHEIVIEPYSVDDKMKMSLNFFLPKSCKKLNFNIDNIQFTDTALKRLITHYTDDELGVRQLEERIDEIILKLNWIRLTSDDGNLNSELSGYHFKEMTAIKFPLKVTTKLIDLFFS